MKIEDYLSTLPKNIINGDDVQLPENSLREIFNFVNLNKDDVFYHLGCGDGMGIEIAIKEYNVKVAKGIDTNQKKIDAARRQNLENSEFICDDVRNIDFDDATVILFWFTEEKIIEPVTKKFQCIKSSCRIITVLEPLLNYMPTKVRFPYLMYKMPFTTAKNLQEQLLAIFDVKCIDFVTAWEYAERYTKAIGIPEAGNDRFLTIMQSVIIWINAKNLGVTCDEEMPESIKTYISILKEFFGIEVEHLLK